MDEKEFVLTLIDKVNEKRKEINTLTSRILALESDLNPKNVLEIKQNINSIINAIASFTSPSGRSFLNNFRLKANNLLTQLNEYQNDEKSSISFFKKDEHIIFLLDHFCSSANTWNPLGFEFTNKRIRIEFKNLNFSLFNVNP
jgi:hypothetical protein